MRVWLLAFVALLVSGCTGLTPTEEPQAMEQSSFSVLQAGGADGSWSWTGSGRGVGVADCDTERATVTGESYRDLSGLEVQEGLEELDVTLSWTGSPDKVCLYLQHEDDETWQPFFLDIERPLKGAMQLSVPAEPGSWRVVVGWSTGGLMSYDVRVEGR